MTQKDDHRALHRFLAIRDGHTPPSLELHTEAQVATSKGSHTAVLIGPNGQCQFAYNTQPRQPLVALLRHYPTPVTIDGIEVPRTSFSATPWIIRRLNDTHQGRHEQVQDDEQIQVPTREPPDDVVPMILVNGLTYINRHPQAIMPYRFHVPDPERRHELHQHAVHHLARHNVRYDPDDEKIEELEILVFKDQLLLIPSGKNVIQEISDLILESKEQALRIAGFEGGYQNQRKTRFFSTWQGQHIVPTDGATPTTVYLPHEYYSPKHLFSTADRMPPSKNRPMAYTVEAAVRLNRDLKILPVLAPRDRRTVPDVRCEAVTLHYDHTGIRIPAEEFQENHNHLTEERPDEISLELLVSHPDGTVEHITKPAHIVLLGDYENEKPLASRQYHGNTDQLAQLLTSAYYRPPAGKTDPDCCQGDDNHHEDYEAQMLTLAVRTIQSSHAAFRHEIEQHWANFKPTTPAPAGFPYRDTVAQLLAANARQKPDPQTPRQAQSPQDAEPQ